jgi:outer membrane protein OmpA-like peptidoglycan-associated protein
MQLWKTIPFATALLVLQAQAPNAGPMGNAAQIDPLATAAPLYRVTVVQGSAKAINYQNLKSTTKIELKGTVLAPNALGLVKIKSKDGKIEIISKFKDVPPATTFGGEYLTYVLWGVSTEGRATNLGEVVLKNGKCKLEVVEALQTFGLIVTAEPYFAVSQPSDVVIMENGLGKGSEQVELIDAKFDLLKRGQYTLNVSNAPAWNMDKKTPFDVYQARNAVLIARAAGAATYAAEPFGKAEEYLRESEGVKESKKKRIIQAREAVQRAEDARLISVQRQAADQLGRDKMLAQAKLDATRESLNTANTLAAAAASAAVEAHQETRDARAENEGLRAELLKQFNAVLATRATARGLIVNMSGVLFQTGKAVLQPAGREKLSKIAGILSAHKGLKLEAEGFTDSTGTEAFNQTLSEARAKNAMEYLIAQGVPTTSISSQGFGKGNPIASNATRAGRQENRRVELVVSGAGITDSATATR